MKRVAEVASPVVIHKTAIVHPSAELDHGVEIEPYAIVGRGVRIGANTRLGPRVFIEKDTTVGRDCRIANGAVLGTDPQDLKYEGEQTFLHIGDRTVIREFATLNRGTLSSRRTLVGSDCLLMAYTHIAHDCELGNHVIVANATNMAGHVTIEDWATISGLVAIHQSVRIGSYAFVGGASRITQDIPPFCRASGNPTPKLYGLNTVGLERRGIAPGVRRALKRTYRLLFQSELNISQAIERVEADPELSQPEVGYFLDFIRNSERGITF